MSYFDDRRAFLRSALAAGAAWAAADLLEVEAALAFASQQASAKGAARPSALTPAQMDVVAALCGRIIPSIDGRPGAREAGAQFFIDRALATFNAGQRTLYVDGVADLDRRALGTAGGKGFAALTAAQQDDVIREIAATPFFEAARVDAVVGTFALPSWGGNREYAGWHLLGLDHQVAFQPPFGYYDAEGNGKR